MVGTATVEWVEEPLWQRVRAADMVRRYGEMDTRNSEKGREKIETAAIRHVQNHFLGIVLLIASRGCDIKAGEAHSRILASRLDGFVSRKCSENLELGCEPAATIQSGLKENTLVQRKHCKVYK